MRQYVFSAEEVAKLCALLDVINSFLHTERTGEELIQFQKKYYKYVNDVNYKLLGSRVPDDIYQREITEQTRDSIEDMIAVYLDLLK